MSNIFFFWKEIFLRSTNIGLHHKNLFKEGELQEAAVAEVFSVTATGC
jgi:hypothetical protein